MIVLAVLFAAPPGRAASPAIPEPPELEADVRFWMRVYSEVTTNEGFIHDARNLAVVYESLRFEPGLPPAGRQQQVNAAREHWQAVLRRLGAGEEAAPGDEQAAARVRSLWGEVPPARLAEAADEVRFQLGQADRFRAGLLRSGRWESHIARNLAAAGVPPELAVLPHVESSFQPEAQSKAGAAGLWQFIRSTGRRFLRIDRTVDERLDPYRSSEAAAQLLAYNHALLGSWPLAITAYNSGAAGMRRAKDAVGSDDIVRILREYHGATFGFASRNYYPSFLAALRLDRDPERYFGPLVRHPEAETREVVLSEPLRIESISRAAGVGPEALRELNPALRPPVWARTQPVPRGYHLRLPVASAVADAATLVARVEAATAEARAVAVPSHASIEPVAPATVARATPPPAKAPVRVAIAPARAPAPAAPARVPAPAAAVPTVPTLPAEPAGPVHVVMAGESLASIALAAGIEPLRLMRLNSLGADDRIYEGQQLLIGEPTSADAGAEAALAAADDRREQAQASAVLAAEGAAPALSAEQARAQGPRLALEPATPVLADPIDYGVQAGDTVRVAAAETLGHLADWSGMGAARLRELNGLNARAAVRVGQRLKVDLRAAGREAFERRRRAYHQQLQSAYFATHRIEGITDAVARTGDSLWQLARRAGVPDWLVQQYNPDLDFGELRAGMAVHLPRVQAVE